MNRGVKFQNNANDHPKILTKIEQNGH